MDDTGDESDPWKNPGAGLIAIQLVAVFVGLNVGLAVGSSLGEKLLAAVAGFAATGLSLLAVWWLAHRKHLAAPAVVEVPAPGAWSDATALAVLALFFPTTPVTLFNVLFYLISHTEEATRTSPEEGLAVAGPEIFVIVWALVGLCWCSVCATRVWRRAWSSVAVTAMATLLCGLASFLNVLWFQQYLGGPGR